MHSSYNFKPEYSVEKSNSGQHLVDEITGTHRTIPIFCTTLTPFSERQQPSKNIGLFFFPLKYSALHVKTVVVQEFLSTFDHIESCVSIECYL